MNNKKCVLLGTTLYDYMFITTIIMQVTDSEIIL